MFSTEITTSLAREHALEVREGVRHSRFGRQRRARGIDAGPADVTIRVAQPADAEAVRRLAELDSQDAPHGYVLVAEAEGQLRAAVAVADGAAIADPFHPTAALVSLLAVRAGQLRVGEIQPSRTTARRNLVAVPNR
jgi:hypothetical protein